MTPKTKLLVTSILVDVVIVGLLVSGYFLLR
jgi:hypothetical protein